MHCWIIIDRVNIWQKVGDREIVEVVSSGKRSRKEVKCYRRCMKKTIMLNIYRLKDAYVYEYMLIIGELWRTGNFLLVKET